MGSAGEPTLPPVTMTRKDKRDLLLVGAAIVVTVIVVGALIIPPPPPPPEQILEAKITPGTVFLAAGRTIALNITLTIDDDVIPYSAYTREWHVNPQTLGIVDDRPVIMFPPKTSTFGPVNFTAGKYSMNGNVTCVVTYQDRPVLAVTNITVGPPEIDNALITPSDSQVLVSHNITLELMVRNSLGERTFDFSASWSLSGMDPSDYQMNRTSGESVKLLPKTPGVAELTALVVYESDLATCNTTIEAIVEPPRNVYYRWYDMFNVSFGSWYDIRWPIYHSEKRISDSYPWLMEGPRGGGIVDTYGGMRLNVTARNLTEVSMNERPLFLPHLGEERGGNVVIDWYMQYLTTEELTGRYRGFSDADDGWIISLNGTVSLDMQAAKGVLNLTDDGFEGFEEWWSANAATVIERYSRWLAIDVPLNIDLEDTYGYYFQLFTFGLDASKVGDTIVLSYDVVTWGMEVVMMKWLREAFLPAEWWFEDMKFHARIGPCFSDFNIDAAVPRALRASNSTQTGQPCWIWQGMLQTPVPYNDYGWSHSLYSSPYYHINQHYMDLGSWVLPWDPLPGGLPFTKTPISFNLSGGEALRFEWPAGNVLFMTYPFHQNSTNSSAELTLSHSEPNQSDMPSGQFNLNLTSRYVEYLGPYDFWIWSSTQTEHEYLADKWQLYGLLPYGMPYLEFWPVI